MSSSNLPEVNIKLKREIGVLKGVSIIVGVIVGSGIFVSPVGVLSQSGSVGLSLIMWLLTGVFSLVGALVYAELGVTIPKSGGEYAYILESFGSLPAFLCLYITFFVIGSVSAAANSMIFAEYILKPFFFSCEVNQLAQQILAVVSLMVIVAINCYSVKWATSTAVIFTAGKILATLAIIVLGMIQISQGNVSSFDDMFEGSNTNPGKLAMAFYQGFWAFAGWNYLNFLTEEMRNPARNLPVAIVLSILIVTCIYLLVNVAYLGVLRPWELLSSNAVAVTFADYSMGRVAVLMPILVGCSVFGSINGEVLSMSRVPFSGAQQGHMPSILAMVSYRYFTPLPSILLMFFVALLFQMFSQLRYLIELSGFAFCVICGMSVAGLIKLRLTRPNLVQPFKLPLGILILFLLTDLFILGISIIENPREFLFSTFLLLSGIPIYLFGVSWERKPYFLTKKINWFTQFLQKLLQVVYQESESDSPSPKNGLIQQNSDKKEHY